MGASVDHVNRIMYVTSNNIPYETEVEIDNINSLIPTYTSTLERALDKNGFPLGLQIIGKPFDEQNILNIAYSMEEKINFKNKISDWWI